MLARRLQKGLDMRCLDLRIIVITTAAAAMTLTASATASAMAQAGNLIAPAASAVSRPAGRGPNLAARSARGLDDDQRSESVAKGIPHDALGALDVLLVVTGGSAAVGHPDNAPAGRRAPVAMFTPTCWKPVPCKAAPAPSAAPSTAHPAAAASSTETTARPSGKRVRPAICAADRRPRLP